MAIGDFCDVTEGKDGLLEVGFLDLGGFDSQVFDAGIIQNQSVRIVGGVGYHRKK